MHKPQEAADNRDNTEGQSFPAAERPHEEEHHMLRSFNQSW